MAQLTLGQQLFGVGKLLDDGDVGIALLAVGVVDHRARKERYMGQEASLGVDVVGDLQARLAAKLPVVLAVAGRDVHETRALIHGHEIARQQGHVEIIALPGKGMRGDGARQRLALHLGKDLVAFDLRVLHDLRGQGLGERQGLARRGLAGFLHPGHLDHHIVLLLGKGDAAVGGDGPGCGGPDHHAGAFKRRVAGLGHRKTHPDGVGGMVGVLDLGVGQGGLFHHRPQHRTITRIEAAVHKELADFADDLRFGRKGHGGIGLFPVAKDAQALEFTDLDAEPLLGEGAALLTEADLVDLVLVLPALAVAFLDLPFNRQAVAVPARNVMRVLSQHLLRAVDGILQDLVERMAHVEMAVGVRRAVVKDEFLAPLRLFAQAVEKADLLPTGEDFRLLRGQAGAHRKIGLGQKDGGLIVACHGFGSPVVGRIAFWQVARRVLGVVVKLSVRKIPGLLKREPGR